MFKINLKAVSYGALLFFSLVILSTVVANIAHVSLASGPISWAYRVAWFFPGYLAAKFAGKNGVANGAMVGVIVGVVVGVVSQSISNPPPGIDSINGAEVGVLMGLPAAIQCGLGGLIWEVINASRKK